MTHDPGWAITPMLAGQLKERLADRPGRRLRTLELGSGRSTEIFRESGAIHVALEHDEARAKANRATFAPLDPATGFYMTPGLLTEPFDVVLIDGPPQDLGSRRGILAHIEAITHRGTTIIVDDTHREKDHRLADAIRRRFQFRRQNYHDGRGRRWAILDRPIGVERFAVGVTTAPRPEPTLRRTLESLARAGFGYATVFAEPGSATDWIASGTRVDTASTTLGCWFNWLRALRDLRSRIPNADAYLVCQDDVVFCGDLAHYLGKTLWPAATDRVGLCSPYCPTPYAKPARPGWNIVNAGRNLTGALCWAIPPASADWILGHLARRWPEDPDEKRIDLKIGEAFAAAGRSIWYHTPSLAQHTGSGNSALGNPRTNAMRCARNFVGEDYRPVPFYEGKPQ